MEQSGPVQPNLQKHLFVLVQSWRARGERIIVVITIVVNYF